MQNKYSYVLYYSHLKGSIKPGTLLSSCQKRCHLWEVLLAYMMSMCLDMCCLLHCWKFINLLGKKNAAKLLCGSIDISHDPSMAVTRLSDWGWQVNLSGDLLSSEWWHHDKAECHHFASAGKEIGREMAESWTGLHDAKAVPCPTTLPCFHQGGFGPLLYSQSRLLIGVHVFQIWVRPCVEKNSFIRCQSFVLTTRESSFNILGHSF